MASVKMPQFAVWHDVYVSGKCLDHLPRLRASDDSFFPEIRVLIPGIKVEPVSLSEKEALLLPDLNRLFLRPDQFQCTVIRLA